MKRLLFLLLTIPAAAQVAAPPVFSPTGGIYHTAQTVTITEPTGGALVFCTTDGSQPDLASTQYLSGATVTFSSTGTLNCIAAVPGVVQTAIQNLPPPPGSTTWWKAVDCVNGGASGVPSSTSHTSGNATPSLSGASMEFGMVPAAGKQTNCLWAPHPAQGACDNCTHFFHKWSEYLNSPAGLTQEDDHQQYTQHKGGSPAVPMRMSFGIQCVSGTGFEFFGNSNTRQTAGGSNWLYSGINGSNCIQFHQWMNYQVLTHTVSSEFNTNPCTDINGKTWPYLYFDKFIVNGTVTTPASSGHSANWKACANALPCSPTCWASEATVQYQIDRNMASPTLQEYYTDNDYWLVTYDPSSTSSSTYTITPLAATPKAVIGGRGVIIGGGGAVIQ